MSTKLFQISDWRLRKNRPAEGQATGAKTAAAALPFRRQCKKVAALHSDLKAGAASGAPTEPNR